MDSYEHSKIEKKWQKCWDKSQFFKADIQKRKKKILHFGDVSLSVRKNTHGTCAKLYTWRCSGKILQS